MIRTSFVHEEFDAMRRVYQSGLLAIALCGLAVGTALADNGSDHPVKDSYITSKVKAELAKDKGTSARHIHVTTKDGVVMLDGTVKSEAEKELAEKDAKRVAGVTDVRNDLTVR